MKTPVNFYLDFSSKFRLALLGTCYRIGKVAVALAESTPYAQNCTVVIQTMPLADTDSHPVTTWLRERRRD